MLFVCYPKCSTCQKARRYLDDHGISYELRDIKLDRPTLAELKAWHARSELPLKRFFNTSGLLYKNMELKDKLPGMNGGGRTACAARNGRYACKAPAFDRRNLRARRL